MADADVVLADAGPTADARPCMGVSTVFFNFDGGTYSPGTQNDPITNTTTILNSETVAAPADLTSDAIGDIVACARQLVTPYNIRIVTSDPGTIPHHEIVFTDSLPTDFGFDNTIVSVSPFQCFPFFNVGFVFSSAYGEMTRLLCEEGVRYIMVAASIDHLYDCKQISTYLSGCGDKGIYDEDTPCGEYEERECFCGETTTNPHEAMLDRFGPACGGP